MGTTSKGYPFPEDTDPIAQGAQAIKNLANAIDFGAARPNSGSRKPLASDLASTYPTGLSVDYLSNTEAPANGWPGNSYTIIFTLVGSGTSSTFQIAWTATNQAWGRWGNSNAWNPWRQVAGPALNANVVNVGVSNAVTGSAAVTFSAGRFSAAPSVVATTEVGDYFAAVVNTTASGTTIWVRQNGGVAATKTVPVDWQAMERAA
jgi:hypothetical protein